MTSSNPLDTLVLNQLQELRRTEDELVRRYASISSGTYTSAAFATEVSLLQQRADRLHRMLEGMSFHPTYVMSGPSTPAAA